MCNSIWERNVTWADRCIPLYVVLSNDRHIIKTMKREKNVYNIVAVFVLFHEYSKSEFN